MGCKKLQVETFFSFVKTPSPLRIQRFPEPNQLPYVKQASVTKMPPCIQHFPEGRKTLYKPEICGQVVINKTGTAFPQTDTITYGYNNRSEVTSADSANGAGPHWPVNFEYDNIGNRLTSSSRTGGTYVSALYTSNNLNQYTEIESTGDPLWSPSYDTDGNMTSNNNWTYTWNAENRLISALWSPPLAKSPTQKLTFLYDYQGRRVSKQTYTGTPENWTLATETRFLYNGWNLVEEFSIINSQLSILNSYTWGLDLSQSLQGAGGVGGLLSTTNTADSATYFVTYDANGNVSEYLDSSGTIQAHYEYSPFGKVYYSSGAKKDDFLFKFSTKYQDSETNLLYYGYRFYDAELGRWLNRDPIGENGGLNVYGFVTNNAIVKFDKLGLLECCGTASYDPNSYCCVDSSQNLVLARIPMLTNSKSCSAYSSSAGIHCYLSAGGSTYGFYPGSSDLFGGPGIIVNPDPYAGTGTCNTVELDQCEYDISKFNSCVSVAATGGPPNYNLITFNCCSWVSDVISNCKSIAKR